jgi:hypothetical protein
MSDEITRALRSRPTRWRVPQHRLRSWTALSLSRSLSPAKRLRSVLSVHAASKSTTSSSVSFCVQAIVLASPLSLSQVQDLGLTSTQAALEHRNVVLSLLGVRGSNVSSSAAAGACGSLGTRIVTGCSARLFLTARLVWCQWTLAIFREKRHPLP